MIAFFAFMGLALFWLGLIWLVRRDQGWVGITEATRLRLHFLAAMTRIANYIGDTLLPVFEAMTKSLVKAAEPMRDLNDALERGLADVEAGRTTVYLDDDSFLASLDE